MAPRDISVLSGPLTSLPFNNQLEGPSQSLSVQNSFFTIVKQQRLEDLVDFLSLHLEQVDLDCIDRRTGFTALSIASIEGSLRKVRKLVKLGADARRLDGHGYASIHYATAYGHTELSDFLIKNALC